MIVMSVIKNTVVFVPDCLLLSPRPISSGCGHLALQEFFGDSMSSYR